MLWDRQHYITENSFITYKINILLYYPQNLTLLPAKQLYNITTVARGGVIKHSEANRLKQSIAKMGNKYSLGFK